MSNESTSLSRREQLAVQGVVAGKTATAALLEAGYSESVARTQQKAVLGKPRILQALEEAGVSTKLLARTMKEGLAAKKAVYHDGRLVAQEPDHGTRHKFAKTALQLRGDLGRDVEEQGDTWESLVFAVARRRAQVPAPAIEE